MTHSLSLLTSIGCALWMVLCLQPRPTWAAQTDCPSLFKNKQYLQAGQCFKARAEAMGPSVKLSKIQRYLKGQNLRNAALCYQKAAAAIQNQEQAAYLREQALFILQTYLKDNLCQRRYLCKLAKGETLELLNKIKYVQLSIVTSPNKRASVTLKGYKTMIQYFSPPQWNKQIRPGRYIATVKYAGTKTITKEIIAAPGKPMTITALAPRPVAAVRTPVRPIPRRIITRRLPPPPTPKAKPSIVPWIVAGTGLAIAGVGTACLLIAQSDIAQRDKIRQTLQADTNKETTAQGRIALAQQSGTASQRREMDRLHNSAATLILPGWVLAGVGVGTLVTGIVLFARQPK